MSDTSVTYALLWYVDPPDDPWAGSAAALLLIKDQGLDLFVRALARDAADAYCDRLWGTI